jgi:hypothetical protein
MGWLVTMSLITAAVVVLVFPFAATLAADHHPSMVMFLPGLACPCDALWLAGYSCPATKVRTSFSSSFACHLRSSAWSVRV